ncbi:MAG: hypothetical protein LUH49_03985 [Cloacibacillus porcorum]|nr:hypothetical protein [Cloacibacillus porcorum]MCD7876122.1 hypothetical protein [Cloacibacillus porcorum]
MLDFHGGDFAFNFRTVRGVRVVAFVAHGGNNFRVAAEGGGSRSGDARYKTGRGAEGSFIFCFEVGQGKPREGGIA